MQILSVARRSTCQHLSVLAGLLLAATMANGQGTIVYQQFEIPTVNGWPVIGLPTNPYQLDMDGDGTTDLVLQSGQDGFAVFPQTGAAVLAMPSGPFDLNSYGLPLSAGQEISSLTPVASFWDADSANGSLLTSGRNVGAIGLFTGQIAYLGVQFTCAGQLHYGYLHLDVSFVGANTGNLLALAWDTRPGTSIIAGAVPEPSTFALLGIGLVVLCIVRRRCYADTSRRCDRSVTHTLEAGQDADERFHHYILGPEPDRPHVFPASPFEPQF
jgi:hypothetical protein